MFVYATTTESHKVYDFVDYNKLGRTLDIAKWNQKLEPIIKYAVLKQAPKLAVSTRLAILGVFKDSVNILASLKNLFLLVIVYNWWKPVNET